MNSSSFGPEDRLRPTMSLEAIQRIGGSVQESPDRLGMSRDKEVIQRIGGSALEERLYGAIKTSSLEPMKPVRGQCVDLARGPPPLFTALRPSLNSSSPNSGGPYRRSLSRSSHCLLSSSATPPLPPLVPWESSWSRDTLFTDHVHEGQSTLV